MKFGLVFLIALLLALVACEIPNDSFRNLNGSMRNGTFRGGHSGGLLDDDDEPLDDEQWEAQKCKGQRLQHAMGLSDEDCGKWLDPPKSSCGTGFSGLDPLNKWGWHLRVPQPHWRDLEIGFGIGTALKALGVNTKPIQDGGLNDCIWAYHGNPDAKDDKGNKIPMENQVYPGADGRNRRATGAYYLHCLNPRDGVITANNRVSPATAARNMNPPVPVADLPEFQRNSDILWAEWEALTISGYRKNVRYYFSLTIVNTDTERTIIRAMRTRGKKQVNDWPGDVFDRDSDEAKALMGSPNAAAVAHMLIQHKKDLGLLRIKEVRLFTGDLMDNVPNMLFVVEPVPKEEKPEEEKPEDSGIFRNTDGSELVQAPPMDTNRTFKQLNDTSLLYVHPVRLKT